MKCSEQKNLNLYYFYFSCSCRNKCFAWLFHVITNSKRGSNEMKQDKTRSESLYTWRSLGREKQREVEREAERFWYQMDICDSRVAFAAENFKTMFHLNVELTQKWSRWMFSPIPLTLTTPHWWSRKRDNILAWWQTNSSMVASSICI